MKQYTYKPMIEAPKDGTPIIAVCSGVEMGVMWEGAINDWCYFDEDEGSTFEPARDPRGWRPMFGTNKG